MINKMSPPPRPRESATYIAKKRVDTHNIVPFYTVSLPFPLLDILIRLEVIKKERNEAIELTRKEGKIE